MKLLFRIIRVLIIVAVLVPIVFEIGLRVYISSFAPAQAVAQTIPQPYVGAPYYNSTFLAERKACCNFVMTDYGYVVKQDAHGLYYNTQDGYRVTTDQPTSALHTLWLLGSSTTFDLEVPDAYTKASYLQRMLGTEYRVQNRGMTSADAAQEVHILKQLPVAPGDIVVMFDGSNDMFESRTIKRNRQSLDSSPCHQVLNYAGWSLLVRSICVASWLSMPDAALVKQTFNDYAQLVTRAHDWTLARGARFYHFLQPTIYAPAPQGYEVGLGSNADLYPVVYPIFKNVPYTIDLTHAMDGVRSQVIFFDQVHTNQIGNEAVARAIALQITASFSAF